jgi:hypothetical protein
LTELWVADRSHQRRLHNSQRVRGHSPGDVVVVEAQTHSY